jgi:isopenicillin-N epimerase
LPVGPNFTRQKLIDRFYAALDDKAQLLFLSHISTATGLVLPVAEICTIARSRGVLTVIDGAHAPGMIAVDLRAIGCDFYAANGHKWLLAPCGSGFLYIRPGLEHRVEPLVASWGLKYDGAKAHQRDQDGSTPYIRSHEFQGTRDPAPWLAMPAAIEFQEAIGVELVRARACELAEYTRAKMTSLTGVTPALPDDPSLRAALASYQLPAGDAAAIQRRLWDEFQIETPVLARSNGPHLRVSTHFYNSECEIDRLHAALPRVIR